MPRLLIPAAALFVAACAGASSTATPSPTPAPAPPPAAAAAPPPVVQTPPPQTPPARPATAAFDATGTYEMNLTFGGSPVPVTMELWKENGAWRGYVGNPNLGSADLTTLATDARWAKGTFVVSGGPTFVFEWEVKADNTLTGTWSGNGDGSAVTGKKTK